MPLMTVPILVFSIVLVITSVVLALFVLMHKGRGGGLSDLFGGGISSSMGGFSVAERNLDRLTVIIAGVWLGGIVALGDRKSTRLNSSHANISYAVFWL